MRKHHLILVTPLLGAGLVLGTVEAPQAVTHAGTAGAVASSAVHKANTDNDRRKKRKRPSLVGYRDGYRQGFSDGRNDCRRSGHRHRGYATGWMAGYNSGFSAGCAQSRHKRP